MTSHEWGSDVALEGRDYWLYIAKNTEKLV